MRLQNRTALITGGAQGIGRAIALRFAQEGARIAVADLQEDRAIAVAREIEATGGKALALQADVSKDDDAQRIVARTVETFGQLNILVNNAGMEIVSKLEDMSETQWDRLYAVNVKGVPVHEVRYSCAAQSGWRGDCEFGLRGRLNWGLSPFRLLRHKRGGENDYCRARAGTQS
jgi:NAD(P)-dependent dehydrogenase (short-subunit alcohol dehydrogenase family)